ncbi:enoyl-ACP reductase [Bacillus pseudomycoides]|nr:enoyl-ACP reductase [Bacillus pseudomycoides]PEK82125.1 enoyl-ACP reductase [Bacillus pseudomycoides]PEN09800.1 enoyl-ACP reductase [Bacillus pseudomycoides]PGB84795.1 enoyl-ACP reductase [Bacillus pseudomycoides]PHE55067.1 enoyl-ACP reductase [Bacillus pseudomycoides]
MPPVSVGETRTLSAKRIGDFNSILKHAPLRRNVTQEEVGNTALFLFSDLASGVTGENIHVDSGYHILG